jgi:hypothetical protein
VGQLSKVKIIYLDYNILDGKHCVLNIVGLAVDLSFFISFLVTSLFLLFLSLTLPLHLPSLLCLLLYLSLFNISVDDGDAYSKVPLQLL